MYAHTQICMRMFIAALFVPLTTQAPNTFGLATVLLHQQLSVAERTEHTVQARPLSTSQQTESSGTGHPWLPYHRGALPLFHALYTPCWKW